MESKNNNNNQGWKRKRFIDLGEKRVNNALKALKQIQNLSNKHNYTCDSSESKLIISTLQKAVGEVKSAFEEGSGTSENSNFSGSLMSIYMDRTQRIFERDSLHKDQV